MYAMFQQVSIKEGKPVRHAPMPPERTDSRFAVVLHLYYPDLWPELAGYLRNITLPFDLYVTLPPHCDDETLRTLLSDPLHPTLFIAENRGRDVLPFLQVMHHIGTDRYKLVCKLHSKKTGDSPLGRVWRRLLYFDLIGSDKTVCDIVAMFDEDETIGIVTGKNTILDSRRYDYGNTAKIDRLVDEAGYVFQDEYLFAGGTMFWIRTALLKPVMKLFEEGKLAFEEEKGQKDNTLAHALERFFGIVCRMEGKRIAPAPTRYKELDETTLEETASLVLSQSYRGEEAFVYQNRIIQELNETAHTMQKRIDELEELADLRRRFKKTLKSYTPQPLWRILQLAKRAVWTLRRNPAVVKKVWFYLKRGEIGHIVRKLQEKGDMSLRQESEAIPIIPQRIFKRFVQSDYALGEETIDIIIPVYNGMAYLPKLFDSIQKHTTSPYRLIVVEDAGSDENVRPYLKERLAAFDDAILIEHDTNRGFVRSVNEAVARSDRHFVILNTDTEVPAFWLERLMYPIVHGEKIASTTPFTNAGTIASFPEFLKDNPIFEGLDVETLDRAFRMIDPEPFYETIPTGVGFCMGVNRTLVEQIGFFDEETFGKGYGEENDWCQRAIAQGYRNLLVPNLFVYHKHGGSFASEEKRRLMQENGLKLLQRHPDYDKEVQAYIAKDPHATLRKLLVMLASSKAGEGISLIVDHALGGGANIYAREKLERDVSRGRKVLYVTYNYYTARYVLQFRYGSYAYDFALNDAEGLRIVLEATRLREIFVNALVSYRETATTIALIKDLKTIHQARLIVPIHDFYPVCPNYTLVDDSGRFCGIPEDKARCERCLAHSDAEWRSFGDAPMDLPQWRTLWQALLEEADEIVLFSENSRDLIQRAYPMLKEERLAVRPHQVSPLPKVAPDEVDTPKRPITLGVLGAINRAKGALVIKRLSERIEEEGLPIRIVLFGEISEPIRSKSFKTTGRYDRDALPGLVRDEEVDLFWLPSVCPETFSYTTEEIMTMGYPLIVFPVGAPAERVARYDKGVVLDETSADAVLDYLKARFRL